MPRTALPDATVSAGQDLFSGWGVRPGSPRFEGTQVRLRAPIPSATADLIARKLRRIRAGEAPRSMDPPAVGASPSAS